MTVQKYYSSGSAQIAVRTIQGESDTLQWLLSDHLGSTSTTANADGTWNSTISYTAFGEIRTSSGITPTEFRYTGQLRQAELGLYYYVARWYDPYLNHFVQADTIVPNAGDSAAYDRYSYGLNNPVKYIDPSGHKVCDAKNGLTDCITTKDVQKVIQQSYGWTLTGNWSAKETDNVLVTAASMADAIRIKTGSSGKHWMEKNIGKVTIKKGSVSCPPYKCNYSDPLPYSNQVVLISGTMNNLETGRHILVHEIVHLIDKNSGYLKMGTLFGGGYSDQMVRDLGGDPARSASGGYRASGLGTIGKNGISIFRDAIFRFEWGGFEIPKENRWENAVKGNDIYGDQDGPDYFANAFAYTLFGSPNVVIPQNASKWMNNFFINN